MHEAIGMHIRGLLEDGLPVPKSHSSATFIAVQS
jgi:predicted RNase H-like HicB family nuclease